jgi:hypothetical protein
MNALPKLPGLDLVWLAIPLAALVYALLVYDARRKDSPAAGDDQLGIKTVAATLAVLATWVLATGLQGFLLAILTFDDFWERLKGSLPSLLVGGLVLVGAALVLFPRTNAEHYPKAKRLAAGVVALVSGVALVPALVNLLDNVFEWPSWRLVATALAQVIDAGVMFVIGLAVLGKLSGVKMPERAAGMARPGGLGGPGPMAQPLGGMVQPGPGPGYAAPPMQQPPPQGYAASPMQQQPPQGYAAPPMQPPQGYPAPPPGPGGYPPQGG